MSGTTSTHIASKPVPLALMLAGAAVVGAGSLCYGIGKAMTSGCREVYKMCKEGHYPADRLQMVHSPITNIDGMTTMLATQGFSVSSLTNMIVPDNVSSNYLNKDAINFVSNSKIKTSTSKQCMTGAVNFINEQPFAAIKNDMSAPNMNILVASNCKGEKIILLNSDDGIGLIGDNVDLLQGKIQDFATQEIVSVLRDIDFKVRIEEKLNEKVITASNKQMEEIQVSIEKGAELIHYDTRKTRRPKCDIIQQLIKDRLGEKNITSSLKQIRKRKERSEEISLKRKI